MRISKSRVLTCSAFAAHPWLFRFTLFALLAFFAFAAVHELIPGVCALIEGDDEECAFCKLLFTVTLVLAILVRVFGRGPAKNKRTPLRVAPARRRLYPPYALRAPPSLRASLVCALPCRD